MSSRDPARVWSLNYSLLMNVITGVSPQLAKLGVDSKELFLLAAIDEHPHPAELARVLCTPRPTISVMLKRLQAAGMLEREIDATDLRRHRLTLTSRGARTTARGLALLSHAFGSRLQRLKASERAQYADLLEKLSLVG